MTGLVERLRSSAAAFRWHNVYTQDGDPVRLYVQADEADEAADLLTAAAQIIGQIEPDFRHPPRGDSIERRIERAAKWLADYTKGME